VVRMWTELAEEDDQEWRGQVVHAHSGEKTYFRYTSRILSFITSYLASEERGAGSKSGGMM
ncbi:MAG: hypothetical protein ACE5JU_15600, partial [Candidatus Binatia bacterium]